MPVFLYENLQNESIVEMLFKNLSSKDYPLFVPIIVRENLRGKLRTCLIENQIYCPVHWPLSKYVLSEVKAHFIFQHELSLICDQRYTESMLSRMVDIIRIFIRKYKI